MQIRDAEISDALAIAALHTQSAAHLRTLGDDTDFKFSAESYLRDGFGENRAFGGLVAEEENQLWGYLLYNFSYDTDRAIRILFVLDLLVDENIRGKGIGRKLMDAAAEIAQSRGAVELQWAVYSPNASAIRFYENYGGELIEDIRLMRKEL